MEHILHHEDPFLERDLTGCIEIQHVAGKSVATRVYGKYPLKFIIPSKAASSTVDVIWIYALSYGGGFVSGDCIYFKVSIGEKCTGVLTTQASTKVYKSVQGQISEQMLQVSVGSKAVFAVLPDPVTCFSAAKYKQFQVFSLANDANIILVDWLTSGRRQLGEVWAFDQYKSTNQIFSEGMPLLLDSICLEQGVGLSVAKRMQEFQVVAMLVLYGPQLIPIRRKVEDSVKLLAGKNFNVQLSMPKDEAFSSSNSQLDNLFYPSLLVSCSAFGPSDSGLVVRMVATSTELVYDFLRQHLVQLTSIIGVVPYAGK